MPKPKNNTQQARNKCTRIKIPIEIKKQIIAKRENGVSVIALAREYNRTTSTICSILKDKEKLKALTASKGVSRRSNKRSKVMDDVERLLLIWIGEKQLQGDTVTQSVICEKAKRIFHDIAEDAPSTSVGTTKEVFKASNGWFERFKERTGISNIFRHGEATGTGTLKAANDFVAMFQELVSTGGYLPQQIFSCDETGLLWREISNMKRLAAERSTVPPGDKPTKDRLTLLLCANASGDLKIKPLLVDRSKNPKSHSSNNQWSVLWRSNKKACVTRDIFTDWMRNAFCPSVKTYLLQNHLPLHALLVMDNAPGHPHDLPDMLLPEEFKFINILLLPANTAPLLQPMDQHVKSTFKRLYMKELFQLCFDATEGTCVTLEDYWKHHFHIATCSKIIGQAWKGFAARTLTAAWKKLWPELECSEAAHIEDTTKAPKVDELVTLASCLGLEVESNDIEELLADHLEDPSTEELMELQRADDAAKELASEEANPNYPSSTEAILQLLNAWDTVASYVGKHHPDEAVARRANDAYETNAIARFRTILKQRQKQSTVEQSSKPK